MTVSELASGIKSTLEREFSSVWVEGELIAVNLHSSGHWYMTISDGDAKLKLVCWKATTARISFRPERGMSVRIRGKVTMWPVSGDMQISISSMEPSGEGALAVAFEQIRSRLEREGLFDVELKRRLPNFPRRVGIITSASGAAYHDVIHVLSRRAASVSTLLIPAKVQGEGSADEIRLAIENANIYNESRACTQPIDVLIVGRGGGSPEDLWAFNDELLARAIRASNIPVISAVGHEIDWTICDMVADVRAATPSAAAEIVAGREEDIVAGLRACEARIYQIMEYRMLETRSSIAEMDGRLRLSFAGIFRSLEMRFSNAAGRLTPANLAAKVRAAEARVDSLSQRNVTAKDRIMTASNESLARLAGKLDALSPLSVLGRGFSLTQKADGTIIRSSDDVSKGDRLNIRLASGKLEAEVLSVEP